MKWLCVFLFAGNLLAVRVSEVFVHLMNSRVHSNDLLQLADAKKLIAEAIEEDKVGETEPGSCDLASLIRKNKNAFSEEAQAEIHQFLNPASKASVCRRTTLRFFGVPFRKDDIKMLADTKANRHVIGEKIIQVDPQNPNIAFEKAKEVHPGIPDLRAEFRNGNVEPE